MKKALLILLALIIILTFPLVSLSACKEKAPDTSGGIETPGELPGDEPGDEPGENPGEEPGDEPGEEPGETPGEDPGENPGGTGTTGGNLPSNPKKEDCYEAN